MLPITIPENDLFDEKNEEFIHIYETTITLEHSLISISKWESMYHKPFLSKTPKTQQEIIDYIKCMTIEKKVDPNVYFGLTAQNINKIKEYIDDPMTATTFSKTEKGGGREVITSELIYYWMIAQEIPPQYEKWHLNRLLTLIRVCNNKNTPSKKMKSGDIRRQNASLNEQRRRMLHSKG